MTAIFDLMSKHHAHCDDLFAQAENAANSGRWDECLSQVGRFVRTLEAHLDAEEEMLFPAFERASGMVSGPTAVMRSEHDKMRSLAAVLVGAARAKDADDFFGTGETLLLFMEQHNRKEEGILYPLCDDHLRDSAELVQNLGRSLEVQDHAA